MLIKLIKLINNRKFSSNRKDLGYLELCQNNELLLPAFDYLLLCKMRCHRRHRVAYKSYIS